MAFVRKVKGKGARIEIGGAVVVIDRCTPSVLQVRVIAPPHIVFKVSEVGDEPEATVAPLPVAVVAPMRRLVAS